MNQKINSQWRLMMLLFFISFLVSCRKTDGNTELAGPDEYFTCSMDPQVIENKAGNCPICHMKLIKVKKNSLQPGQIKLSAQQIELGNITMDTLRVHELAKEINLTGKVAIDQNLSDAISSKVQGRIEKLMIRNVGDNIHKGQLLYEIYSEDLNAAQQEYILASETENLAKGENFSSTSFLEAAKNKLLLYGMSLSQIDRLKATKQVLQIVPVLAMKEGFVSELSVAEGSYVSEGTTLFRIASFNALWVEVQVYLPYLAYVRKGTVADILIPAVSEAGFSGKVLFIDPQIQSPGRFVLARFQIANPSIQLKPGMLATITLKTEKRNSLALPVDAIIQDSRGANVWIYTDDEIFQNIMVTVGMQNSREIEITSGLKEGDIVVVAGAYLLNSEYVFKKGANPMEGHQDMQGMKM